EVAGACFCCRFDDLVGRGRQLEQGERPQGILAAPGGSRTHLGGTGGQPLQDLFGGRLAGAPYPGLFKPSPRPRLPPPPPPIPLPAGERGDKGTPLPRGERGRGEGGFSPKAAYIFRKQLEEADAVVINRIDEMAPAAVAETAALVAKEFPGVPV